MLLMRELGWLVLGGGGSGKEVRPNSALPIDSEVGLRVLV